MIPTIVISETIQVICEKMGQEEAGTSYLSIIVSGLKIQALNPTIAYMLIPILAVALWNLAKKKTPNYHYSTSLG